MLKNCSNILIKKITLGTQIDDTCMEALGLYIQHNESIEELCFAENKITNNGIKILTPYLIGNITMKSLDLSSNEKIDGKSIPCFKELATKTCLSSINIFLTSVTEKNIEQIEKLLETPSENRTIPIKSDSKSASKLT